MGYGRMVGEWSTQTGRASRDREIKGMGKESHTDHLITQQSCTP